MTWNLDALRPTVVRTYKPANAIQPNEAQSPKPNYPMLQPRRCDLPIRHALVAHAEKCKQKAKIASSILLALVDEIVQRSDGQRQALLADLEAIALVVADLDQAVRS